MQSFIRFVDRLALVCAVAAAILVALSVLIITWMIAWRSFGNSAYWEIEASVFLSIAAIFLASPYTLRTKGHVSVDLLEAILPDRATRPLRIFALLVVAVVAAYLVWEGGKMAFMAMHEGERTPSLWAPLKWPIYAAMPIGMGLTCLQAIVEIARIRLSPPDAR
ncbi:TRAP transporter small permease [Stella sp.]|uniref:TRAP transporter small permease n=1 Tax=Stella sp. TaxID=2912054 RepID=UPI0035AFD11C